MRALPLLALFAPSAVYAATLQVGPTRTYRQIQDAIDDATDGDTILVDADVYEENLWIDKDLVITGAGSGDSEVSGDGWTVVVIQDATVTFEGFTVSNRDTGQGFDIDNSVVVMDDVEVVEQYNDGDVLSGLDAGGGAYIHGASNVTITDSQFDDNWAEGSGGGIAIDGSILDISGTEFKDGGSYEAGGGIASATSTLVVDDVLFDQSEALVGGGLALADGSTATVRDTTFDNTVATWAWWASGTSGYGGGLYAGGSTTAVTLESVLFTAAVADVSGGGAVIDDAVVVSIASTFTANDANYSGVGLVLAGAASWNGDGDSFASHVGTNTGQYGGGVYAAETASAVFTASSFTGNQANRGGAIAWASTGTLTVTGSDFSSNRGTNRGGALDLADGVLALSDSTFTDNRAPSGGGVYGSGVDVSLTRSVLCANDATGGSGGALYLGTPASLDLRYNVIAENTATTSGGGVYVTAAAASAGVVNNSFVGNTGGAATFDTSDFDFRNNLVWSTVSGDGVSADTSVSTRTYALQYGDWFSNTSANLGGGLSAVTLDGTNLADDPLLTAWSADGDCSNDDFHQKLGSPLIDAGDPAILDPDGGRSDIGAFGGTGADAALWVDGDGDGYEAMFDCDDTAAAINPSATELCDGVDNDCDGTVDEPDAADASTVYADLDGDGYGDASTSTVACPADGWVADATDCDDVRASVHPGADETCNSRDDDCDGIVDESAIDAETWFMDADGDGYGDPGAPVEACTMPTGAVANDNDCDDAVDTVNPAADELCNGVDDDCDGAVDAGAIDTTTYYLDADGDGHGDPTKTLDACTEPTGYVALSDDCDDGNGAVNPDAAERCNGVDDDCDGVADESDAIDADSWYADADADGYGDATSSVVACEAPTGHVGNGLDCNDADALYHPGAAESCTDTIDYNCDGSVGDADADADGVRACEDCNDADGSVFPGADESCNGQDDDCDGVIDEADAVDATMWYADADADGYGDLAESARACDAPTGFVDNSLDCNDADAMYHPGATEDCSDLLDYNCDGSGADDDNDADGWKACEECDDADDAVHPDADELCDGLDNDCDGDVDEDGATFGTTWYADADADGYGSDSASLVDCSAPEGYTDVGGDCDDGAADVNPDGTEVADDGIDQDCDGTDATDGGDDTDLPVDTGGEDVRGGKCGCVSTPTPAGAWTAILGLLGLVSLRRRK